MKVKQTLIICLTGILATCGIQAQTSSSTSSTSTGSYWKDHFSYQPGTALFEANELQLDLGAFYATRDKNGGGESAWGPAVGISYFITENIGVGADTYADWFRLPYQLNFNAFYRYPLTQYLNGLAPYGVVGFGRQWGDIGQWKAHLGVGAEYRFNPKTGFFTDVQGVFPGRTSNYFLWRFGFRVLLF